MRINFFGNMEFGMDSRMNFLEKWSEMTIEEKIKFIDAKADAMNKAEFDGDNFFGHTEFHFKELSEKWNKMTVEEKTDFINQKEANFKNGDFKGMNFCGRKGMNVENIDAFCEEWMKKTDEEKAEFIRKKKEMRHNMAMHMFSRFRGFGHRM